MLSLTSADISLNYQANSPEDAIKAAGELLVQTNKVEERYIDAMVQAFQEIGPYIVIAPQIAIPHARPENGVLEPGVSLVRLKEPVQFGHAANDPVKLICAICGTDSDSHMGMLQSLAGVLGNKNKLAAIMNADSKEEIISILNGEG